MRLPPADVAASPGKQSAHPGAFLRGTLVLGLPPVALATLL